MSSDGKVVQADRNGLRIPIRLGIISLRGNHIIEHETQGGEGGIEVYIHITGDSLFIEKGNCIGTVA